MADQPVMPVRRLPGGRNADDHGRLRRQMRCSSRRKTPSRVGEQARAELARPNLRTRPRAPRRTYVGAARAQSAPGARDGRSAGRASAPTARNVRASRLVGTLPLRCRRASSSRGVVRERAPAPGGAALAPSAAISSREIRTSRRRTSRRRRCGARSRPACAGRARASSSARNSGPPEVERVVDRARDATSPSAPVRVERDRSVTDLQLQRSRAASSAGRRGRWSSAAPRGASTSCTAPASAATSSRPSIPSEIDSL